MSILLGLLGSRTVWLCGLAAVIVLALGWQELRVRNLRLEVAGLEAELAAGKLALAGYRELLAQRAAAVAGLQEQVKDCQRLQARSAAECRRTVQTLRQLTTTDQRPGEVIDNDSSAAVCALLNDCMRLRTED